MKRTALKQALDDAAALFTGRFIALAGPATRLNGGLVIFETKPDVCAEALSRTRIVITSGLVEAISQRATIMSNALSTSPLATQMFVLSSITSKSLVPLPSPAELSPTAAMIWNHLVSHAVNLLFLHEIGHILHGHIDFLEKHHSMSKQEVRQAEIEADLFALWFGVGFALSSDLRLGLYSRVSQPQSFELGHARAPSMYVSYLSFLLLLRVISVAEEGERTKDALNYFIQDHPHACVRARLAKYWSTQYCLTALEDQIGRVSASDEPHTLRLATSTIMAFENDWVIAKPYDVLESSRHCLCKEAHALLLKDIRSDTIFRRQIHNFRKVGHGVLWSQLTDKDWFGSEDPLDWIRPS